MITNALEAQYLFYLLEKGRFGLHYVDILTQISKIKYNLKENTTRKLHFIDGSPT